MIVDRLRTRELDSQIERSARVRWHGGEASLRYVVPAGYQTSDDDGSPYLAALLLCAMRRRESLEIDANASPRLLASIPELEAAFQAYDPWLHRSRVTATGDPQLEPRAEGVACFFSRGVDSMFTAARERRPGENPLSELVICDDFAATVRTADEKIKEQEAHVRAGVTKALELPLITVRCNIKEITDELFMWGDVHGAALASVGLTLAGRYGRVVVPSSDNYATVGYWGSSPLVDPLISTETVELEHDSIARGRFAKVEWLAKERPELLPFLQVCLRGRRTDNCGRCTKCLATMLALRLAGVELTGLPFPAEIDPKAIEEMARLRPQASIGWAEVCHQLEAVGEEGEIRAAIQRRLRGWARPPLRERIRARMARRGTPSHQEAPLRRPNFGELHAERLLAVWTRGEPYPPLNDTDSG